MPWFKVDDQLHDHRKVRKLGKDKLPALGLWSLCGSWAGDTLSDGFVPAEIVRRFDPSRRYAKRLVDVGLWEVAEQEGEEGYRFHEWEAHQPRREDVLVRRDAARNRMRKVREERRNSAGSPERSEGVRANTSRTDGGPDPENGSRNGNGAHDQWSQNGNGAKNLTQIKAPSDPTCEDTSAGQDVVFARTSREVRLTPTRPDPTRSSSSSARLTVAAALDLEEDDEETGKVIDLIRRERKPNALGPYVRTLAENGDLVDFLARVRAPTGPAAGYAGPTHGYVDDGTDHCRTCRLPATNPRHGSN